MITCNLIVHKGPPCSRIRLQPYPHERIRTRGEPLYMLQPFSKNRERLNLATLPLYYG